MLHASRFVINSKKLFYLARSNIIKPLNRALCQQTPKEVDKRQTLHRTLNATDIYMNVFGDFQIGIIGGGSSAIYASTILKQYPLVKCVHIIDTQHKFNEAVRDAEFIDVGAKLKHYDYEQLGDGKLADVFCNLDIVAILDKEDFHLGHLRPQDQFLASYTYVNDTAKMLATACPNALIAVFTRPVTATTPLVYESFNNYGNCDPNKIIGSVALETMRIESATADFLGLNPACMAIPIVGGADSYSAVPLLSRAVPYHQLTNWQEDFLMKNFRSADVDSGGLIPSRPILSTGMAVAKFILTLAASLKGCDGTVVNAYVRSNVLPVCRYFTSKVCFGRNGVEQIFDMPKGSLKELEQLENSIEIINQCVRMATQISQREFLGDCKLKDTDEGC